MLERMRGYTESPRDYKQHTNTIPRFGGVSKVAARSTSDNGAILKFWVEYPACIGLIYPCGSVFTFHWR